MATDAERVIGDGVLVEVDGIQRRLIFGFAGLKVLEDDFGGIANWLDHFAPSGWRTRRMSALATGVRAGLKHYELDPDALRPFDLEAAVESVMSGLLGPGWGPRVKDLTETIDAAYGQALPLPPKEGRRRGKSSGPASGFPGPGSTAPPSSSSGSDPGPASSAA